MNLYWAVFAILLSDFFPENSHGCHVYVTIGRKRRDASADKQELRDYFTACMDDLAPSNTLDWRSNVDFTVLDTVWFDATLSTSCGSSGTATCWKNGLTAYAVPSYSLTQAQTCVDHYDYDYGQDPPQNRYARKRRKRSREASQSTFGSALKTNLYALCLRRSVQFDEKRAKPDYYKMITFVEELLLPRSRGKRGTPWQIKFVDITLSSSPLKRPIETCGRRHFPQVFSCPSFALLEIRFILSCTSAYNIGSTCSVRCTRDKKLFGPPSTTCKRSGSNNYWSPSLKRTYCVAKG
ncbi:uncharacterized protein LOC143449112 [Clavelina lepadiformis]|uniref:uncharacterized protein LOC143449112 n=1 Tax=Clavelina lepadiformis TaxID=159417 RepID=UPI004042D95F